MSKDKAPRYLSDLRDSNEYFVTATDPQIKMAVAALIDSFSASGCKQGTGGDCKSVKEGWVTLKTHGSVASVRRVKYSPHLSCVQYQHQRECEQVLEIRLNNVAVNDTYIIYQKVRT